MSDFTNLDAGEPLNLSYLNDIASGNIEFIVEMIDIFLEQTPGHVDQLTQAIEDKNWKVVADIAHKIKPTLAFMGVDKAKDSMQSIEHNARNLENLETIEFEFGALKKVCTNLFAQLKDYKTQLESKL